MWSFLQIFGAVVVGATLQLIGYIAYNIFFHPLRHYPGPASWTSSNIAWNIANLRGRLLWRIEELHKQYGPVVRIAPNHLSYTTATAWKDIYNVNPEMQKDFSGFGIPRSPNEPIAYDAADTSTHRRVRRLFAPAFSDRALREQEPIIIAHLDLLITQLHKYAPTGPQDIVKWLNRTSFDIIGYLVFGESFHGLEEAKDASMISFIFDFVAMIPVLQLATQLGITTILERFTSGKIAKVIGNYKAYSEEQVAKVIHGDETANKQGLFFSHVMKENGNHELTMDECAQEARSLLLAGSETTATTISGTLFYLSICPSARAKLVQEIRSTFTSEKDITMSSVIPLKYTNAVLLEALRMFPPAPGSLPRVVPQSGAIIDGQHVPGKAVVGVHQYSANRSPRNFHCPDEFLPERWLGNDVPEALEFRNDIKAAAQPFSYGPRNCIGQNLAWVEIRLILTRILWNFDFELAPESKTWIRDQKPSIIWTKPPLMMTLIPAKR